ncbi:MAG: hypothetical protein LBM56_03005, partial [Burkholderiaceae bacterium]|nr:hypothetical protein [Burkholderiaceae bacterium]
MAILAFVLALAGCGDSSKPVKPEDMDKGYIHFAVNLILEDIIRRGETSPYAQLSPAPVLNPYLMPGTDNVIKDFRRNFTTAEDKYYQLRGTGTMVRGTVNSVDRPNRELVFVQEDKTSKPPFTGTLRLSLDKTRYSETAMPAYAPGDTAVFMCKEYRPIHDFKNETTHQIEIRLIQCTTADDYYAVFQAHIEERLMDIYSGKEPVNPDMAQHLAMFYLAAQSLPKQSVCLSGSFLACHENMMDEIARKYQDVKAVN